jgi:hypothetical protein
VNFRIERLLLFAGLPRWEKRDDRHYKPFWMTNHKVSSPPARASPSLIGASRNVKKSAALPFRPTADIKASLAEPSPVAGTCPPTELVMAAEPKSTEPKRQEPDIPPQKPDIQPEPRPEEIPQDKNFPEKQSPPMRL